MAPKTSRPDGVVGLSDVKVTPRHLDPEYKIELHDPTRGSTGLLQVFSLVPNDAQNPTFTARIDDGGPSSRREPDLDIDIKGVSRKVEADFKNERSGYAGHHHDRSKSPTERIFDVSVDVPSRTIFDGEVTFKVQLLLVAGTGSFSITGGNATFTLGKKPTSE